MLAISASLWQQSTPGSGHAMLPAWDRDLTAMRCILPTGYRHFWFLLHDALYKHLQCALPTPLSDSCERHCNSTSSYMQLFLLSYRTID